MNKILETLGIILGLVLLYLIISILFALPIMWLWNWLIVDIFNLPTINVFQSWGINVLTTLLFKTTTINYEK